MHILLIFTAFHEMKFQFNSFLYDGFIKTSPTYELSCHTGHCV